MRRNRRGAALIEFAFWLLPILILMAGVIELSRMLSLEQHISQATRDAARVGAMVMSDPATSSPPTAKLIQDTAIKHAEEVLNDSGYPCVAGCTVTANWYATTQGHWVLAVHSEYPYTSLLGFFDFTRPVVRDFTMMTQYQP